ncbi:MAG TPA: CpsB/CapC family capsule biosynthesis tyrosine phosphatase [Puia sp.]|jgi:tyrosine-protein phosphatase YwqE|nr:CpsB/CapC family capsule biosynthesis tyrosine phosphatase [Puia sp.]
MFSFFQKKHDEPSDIFGCLSCDMHSHLIPGIDDGARDLEDSLRLIRGLADLGYRKLITTPHVLVDYYPNTPTTIGNGYEIVQAELKKQDIGVEFHAAAEYLLDDHFINLLETDQPLLTLKDKMVLVELSFAVPAINLKEILFLVQLKGYQPVLAHPERYLYFGASKGWYEQLKDAGCLFQLNLLSLKGYYGKGSLELAQYLIKKKYVDLLGTDLHHQKHLENLRSTRISDAVKKLLDTGLIRNATL